MKFGVLSDAVGITLLNEMMPYNKFNEQTDVTIPFDTEVAPVL